MMAISFSATGNYPSNVVMRFVKLIFQPLKKIVPYEIAKFKKGSDNCLKRK